MRGLHLAEVFEDAGISAGKPLASRPAGSRLLAAANKGKVVVVVAKLHRLFRSVADASNVIADFDRKGKDLVSISEGFDATTIYGKAMMQVASVFAELERGLIRGRTRGAMSVKRSRGVRISGHAPFGWDLGDQVVGRLFSALVPSPRGPRQLGQFSACAGLTHPRRRTVHQLGSLMRLPSPARLNWTWDRRESGCTQTA
jgi:DNA invertase Pin-like site-specific DNA recombinase